MLFYSYCTVLMIIRSFLFFFLFILLFFFIKSSKTVGFYLKQFYTAHSLVPFLVWFSVVLNGISTDSPRMKVLLLYFIFITNQQVIFPFCPS